MIINNNSVKLLLIVLIFPYFAFAKSPQYLFHEFGYTEKNKTLNLNGESRFDELVDQIADKVEHKYSKQITKVEFNFKHVIITWNKKPDSQQRLEIESYIKDKIVTVDIIFIHLVKK